MDDGLGSERRKRFRPRWIWLLAVGYCAYATAFILRTSFVIDGHRYYCLLDDAMISMRYAKNWAAGFGLVWNPGGPRVEGFTNPLWVAVMAAAHLLPVDPAHISVLIQLLGAALLTANLFWIRRLSLQLADRAGGAIAVILTACYLPLNNWGLRGSEVAILAPLFTSAVCLAVESTAARRFTPWPFILLGIAVLVRLDSMVALVALALAQFAFNPEHRRRIAAWSVGAAIAALLPQTLLRYWYYQELVPNTYYLKMTGFPAGWRIARGTIVLAQFALANFYLFLFPLMRRPKSAAARTMVLLIGAQFLYSIWVGGDAWEWWGGSNRYISPVLPLLFLLFAVALRQEILPDRARRSRSVAVAPLALFLVGIVIASNSSRGRDGISETVLLSPPIETDENRLMVNTARAIRAASKEDATVAVVWAGIIPYFADRTCIDLLGKNDPIVARRPMHVPNDVPRWLSFWPGHLKWDYRYSIGTLQPDIVAQLWWRAGPDAAKRQLAGYERVWVLGVPIYVRTNSSALRLAPAKSAPRR